MKIPSVCKIDRCVSADETRTVLTAVWLDAKMSQVVATDGRCMAVVPVELGEHDVTGYVTPEALTAGRKVAGKKGTVEIACNGALAVTNGPTFQRPQQYGDKSGDIALGTYPNYRQVLPNKDDYAGGFKIALNVDLLKKIADSIGTDSVVVEFAKVDGQLMPFVVRPTNYEKTPAKCPDAFGVLMPMRLT